MHEISKTFSAVADVTDVYGLLTERLARLIEAQICFVASYHPESGHIRAQSPSYGVDGHLLVDFQFPLESILEALDFTIYEDVDSRTRSELAVPLKVGQHVIGVINAESAKPNAFSDADERILITLAGHLAMAINRLRTALVEHQWTQKLARSNALIAALGHIATGRGFRGPPHRAFPFDDRPKSPGFALVVGRKSA